MDEIIKILEIGFFDGMNDVIINKSYSKKYKIVIDEELKSKLYDIAFILGYNSTLKYIKNNL